MRAMRFIRNFRRYGWDWLGARLMREWLYPSTTFGLASKRFREVKRELAKRLFSSRIRPSSGSQRAVGELRYFWDETVCPASYDILWNLTHAELARRQRGLGHIHVIVVPLWPEFKSVMARCGQKSVKYDDLIGDHKRMWRVQNLVIPCLQLMPTVGRITICGTRTQAQALWDVPVSQIFPDHYMVDSPMFLDHPGYGVETEPAELFRLLEAPRGALLYVDEVLDELASGRKPVVITIRDSEFLPERNSQLDSWIHFANGLDDTLYFPIFVPDTDSSFELNKRARIGRHFLFTAAAWNVQLRAALYQRAWLNLGIGSGPFYLAVHNRFARYVMFLPIDRDPGMRVRAALTGLQVGANPHFCLQGQTWFWGDDTLENIRAAFAQAAPNFSSC